MMIARLLTEQDRDAIHKESGVEAYSIDTVQLNRSDGPPMPRYIELDESLQVHDLDDLKSVVEEARKKRVVSKPHSFRCSQGHVFTMSPNTMTTHRPMWHKGSSGLGLQGCPLCLLMALYIVLEWRCGHTMLTCDRRAYQEGNRHLAFDKDCGECVLEQNVEFMASHQGERLNGVHSVPGYRKPNMSKDEKKFRSRLEREGFGVCPDYTCISVTQEDSERVYWLTPDIVLRDHKVCVEIDNQYTHSDLFSADNDARRNLLLEKFGWTVIRVRIRMEAKIRDHDILTPSYGYTENLGSELVETLRKVLGDAQVSAHSH